MNKKKKKKIVLQSHVNFIWQGNLYLYTPTFNTIPTMQTFSI